MYFDREPEKTFTRWLFVDPGITIGCTFWKSVVKRDYTCFQIKTYTKPFWKVFDVLTKEFDIILDVYKPIVVIFEDLTFRPGSMQSLASVSRGDLLRVTKILGSLMSVCTMRKINYNLRTVQEWKGNITGKVVKSRIKYLTGIKFTSQHLADSFGMSLNEMGIFK